MTVLTFYLPDTLRDWPWPRKINPHYKLVERETREWIESFNAFPPDMQAAFNKCNFSAFDHRCLRFLIVLSQSLRPSWGTDIRACRPLYVLRYLTRHHTYYA